MNTTPANAPANAGAITRVPFMLSSDNVIALPSCSRPTISDVNATRVGPRKPNATPWVTAATSSIQNWTVSVSTTAPIPAAAARIAPWLTTNTSRLGRRSAATPPSGVATSSAIPKHRYTSPSALSRSVRSHARTPRSRNCICTDMNENVPAHHSLR